MMDEKPHNSNQDEYSSLPNEEEMVDLDGPSLKLHEKASEELLEYVSNLYFNHKSCRRFAYSNTLDRLNADCSNNLVQRKIKSNAPNNGNYEKEGK